MVTFCFIYKVIYNKQLTMEAPGYKRQMTLTLFFTLTVNYFPKLTCSICRRQVYLNLITFSLPKGQTYGVKSVKLIYVWKDTSWIPPQARMALNNYINNVVIVISTLYIISSAWNFCGVVILTLMEIELTLLTGPFYVNIFCIGGSRGCLEWQPQEGANKIKREQGLPKICMWLFDFHMNTRLQRK